MKKFIFFISLFLFFIIPVKADISPGVSNCSSSSNLIPNDFISNYRVSSSSVGSPLVFGTRNASYLSYYIKIKASSTYTYHSISSNTTSYTLYFLDSDFNFVSSLSARVDLYPGNATLYTFETPNNVTYLLFNFFRNTVNNSTPSDWEIQLEEGSTFTSYVPYAECTSPPVPDDSSSSLLLSNFYTLYFDRFSYLASGFTNNPYLFAMLGIIFAWVVLELFLHILHLKGGYKK